MDDDLIETLADHICHQLRGSLAAIMAYGELLDDRVCGPLNADQAEQVGVILSRTRLLDRQISEVREAVKVGRGEPWLEPEVVDLGRLCEFHADLWGQAARDCGVELDQRRAAGTGAVLLDSDALAGAVDHAIRGLVAEVEDCGALDLALEAEAGAARLVLSTAARLRPVAAGVDRFAVRWPGEGRRGHELGLGLYLCRSRFEELGGTVRIDGGVDSETRLVVEFRLLEPSIAVPGN
ncbi:histidine kinase dimerization/phospho-acceptor domain-containing protein [Engelhardtia mirabilis]|uniref:histidine kinase n=1 Tax=Engelhardtia mirabilis TaxID=2528011 RepID=A0A518BRH7_9BACT|nr:hypothetical protein Pla133_46700 [Planctomycetes bacterium Pla133]QDV03876.1 hypothetical protein Pla86_46680 [Planctomycetes bacterium Pla86]